MTKSDAFAYSVVLALCLILGGGAYYYDHHTKNGTAGRKPSYDYRTTQGSKQPSNEQREDRLEAQHNEIRVRLVPGDHPTARDTTLFAVAVISAVVGVAGIGFAGINVLLIRRQTGEIHDQRVAMQNTLEAMDRQARIMAEQTEHLRDSVDLNYKNWLSTKKSFQAMKDSQRARLSIELGTHQFGILPLINFKITCHGTTPAYVISSQAITALVPMQDFGWHSEAYGFPIQSLPTVIPVGIFEGYAYILDALESKNPLGEIDNTQRLTSEINKGNKFLHIRIRIIYRDVFDPDKEHELQMSKVYGVRFIEKPRSLSEMLCGKPPEMVLTPYAEWRDSKYKYGQIED